MQTSGRHLIPLLIPLVLVITALTVDVPVPPDHPASVPSSPTDRALTTSLLAVSKHFALVALVAPGREEVEVRDQGGRVVGHWVGPVATARIVCDACPGPVVAVGRRVYVLGADGTWTVDRSPRSAPWIGPSAGSEDLPGDLASVVGDDGHVLVRAATWPLEEALRPYSSASPNYRSDGPDVVDVGSIKPIGEDQYLQAIVGSDPSRSAVVFAVLHRSGVRTSRSIEIDGVVRAYACSSVGGAMGGIVLMANGAARVISFPNGLDHPMEVAVSPIPVNQCSADGGGSTSWSAVGTGIGAGSGADAGVVSMLVRVEGRSVAWERAVAVDAPDGTVTTQFDPQAEVILVMPTIGGTARVDPLTGKSVRAGPIAASAAMEADGAWWHLGFDGSVRVVPGFGEAA